MEVGMKQVKFRTAFFLIFFNIIFIFYPAAYSVDDLVLEKLHKQIGQLIITDEYQYQVIKVSEIVNNLCAVAIEPPYREFPNIIIFQYDPNTQAYMRIYESLSLGIQDKPSTKLDLHTVGIGMDLKAGEDPNVFESAAIQKLIEIGNNHGMVVIPYTYFIHMHNSSKASYTIDKTSYYDLAIKLLGNVYKRYPKDNCVMYDSPNITEMEFTYEEEKYTITTTTDNKQLWKITFEGVDQDNKYLINKRIEVQKKKN